MSKQGEISDIQLQMAGQQQQFGMQPPQNIVIPQGLPPGLAYLGGLSEIKIHQHLEVMEVALNWERNNKYRICNNQEQQFMYAKEDTDCCTRQCCGPMRPFIMDIMDNNFQPLIRVDRPCRCQASFMWCCCLQEMDIQCPVGQSVGRIQQRWTPWKPKYDILDAQEQVVFTIDGECCFCCPCTDIFFKVLDGKSGIEIGQIVKHWGGCREIFGAVNDFSITFPAEIDIMKKALLLGATFLIDFNYFEKKN